MGIKNSSKNMTAVASRNISVPLSVDMGIKEAINLRDVLNEKIAASPPARRPKYIGPSAKVVCPAIKELVAKMFASVSRCNPPKNGVVTQFGFCASVHGWTIQMSAESEDPTKPSRLIINIKHEEFGPNEYGATERIEFPAGILDQLRKAAARGIGQRTLESWEGGSWVSARFSVCPPNLVEAYSRYVPFKFAPGFSAFARWISRGMGKRALV
jgi:hypothetical protein